MKQFEQLRGKELEEAPYVAEIGNIIDVILKDLKKVLEKAAKKGDTELVNNVARFAGRKVTASGQSKGKLYLYSKGK